MKTKTNLFALAAMASALSMSITTGPGQPFDNVESLKNRAVAASPRALEQFPWLARGVPREAEPRSCAGSADTELRAVSRNRALAASPRVLEQFPQLARTATAPACEEFTLAPLVEKAVPAEVTRNRAWAASPRAREEFPALARGYAVPKKGSAKGGASRLNEVNK